MKVAVDPSERSDMREILEGEIKRLAAQYKPKAKFRRCLRCQEPFKPHSTSHYFCTRACGRTAHYLRFNVRRILEA